MSIKAVSRSGVPAVKGTFSVPGVSRWSGSSERNAAYASANSGANSDLLGADTIRFEVGDMVGGVSKKMYETDHSQIRVDDSQKWIPVIYGVGALILFLSIMNLLKK